MYPIEWVKHVEYMAYFFAMEGDKDNDRIFRNVNALPEDMRSSILVQYVTRAMRSVPNILVDKEELLITCNKSHRVFDGHLSTLVGRARVYSHLDVISNILRSAYFNETHYDMSTVFSSNLGFEPSVEYVRKLRKIFPNHTLFKIVPV